MDLDEIGSRTLKFRCSVAHAGEKHWDKLLVKLLFCHLF